MCNNVDNGGGLVDLHVHSMFSDGIFTPEEIVYNALKAGLKAIAITDHDSVAGIPRALEAAKDTGLEILPGVEVSANVSGVDIHILGYFIDPEDDVLVKGLESVKNDRAERLRQMIVLLGANGIQLDEKKVFEYISDASPGRLHLARILLKEGYVRGIKEAFDRYIGNGKSCFVGHRRFDYRDAIALISGAGGVPVLAHPGTMGRDEFIPMYTEAGLKGIEVFYAKHKPDVVHKYSEIAKNNGLILTGGSDCHGNVNGSTLMGSIKVGYNVVETLRGLSRIGK